MKTSKKEILSSEIKKASAVRDKYAHVFVSNGKWAVYRGGNKKASALFNTKEEAVLKARDLKTVDNVVIHETDGTYKVEDITTK